MNVHELSMNGHLPGTRVAANGVKIEMPDSTPMHSEYLHWAVEQGLIGQAELDAFKH